MSYKMMSGIETHVELSTASKIFCGCRVKFGAKPNTQCCDVCTGQPGALPVLNKNAVRLGILAGLCLNCTINGRTRFARKNYFYPDLPKAYQISQQELPLCENGYVELESGKKIRITRIHLEEDAGKLVHEGDSTFIDYNRCGVPLIEIVSAPDISSPKEAREYIEALQSVLRFAGVSDCRMQQGSMRCDVNISVAEEGAPAGTRTELKNLNSVSAVERAMEHEFLRQCNILSGGGRVEQSTLRYDEKSGATLAMRAKEDARDYRYFPEPDIPDIVIPPSEVALIKKSLPRLPAQRLAEYTSLGVGGNAASLLCRYRRACDFFESCLKFGAGAKTAANLIVGTVYASLLTEDDKLDFRIAVSARDMADIVKYVDGGRMNITRAQLVLGRMLKEGVPLNDCVGEDELSAMSADSLKELCREAIRLNPAAAADYRSGKVKAIGGFYGYIKRESGGRADIKLAEQILKELLK